MPLIETNNISGAELAAAQLAKAIGPSGGEVAIVAFHAGSQTNDQRVQGFEGLKRYPKLTWPALSTARMTTTPR